ncbi:hypothetical protein O3P69_013256 [Scylla paramamosain]|uniref:Uncharacterized protein n=1 Tax=Scylla paramamosain TaxID=85552 RepID=A0AAW0U3Y3_SCYPA
MNKCCEVVWRGLYEDQLANEACHGGDRHAKFTKHQHTNDVSLVPARREANLVINIRPMQNFGASSQTLPPIKRVLAMPLVCSHIRSPVTPVIQVIALRFASYFPERAVSCRLAAAALTFNAVRVLLARSGTGGLAER